VRTNCVNCGAAIDADVEKCPFCGTSYFDLTAIDFTSGNPVALRLRLNYGGGHGLISMLAIPHFNGLESETEYMDCYSGGTKLCQLVKSRSAIADVSFTAVARNDGKLFHLKVKEKEEA